MNSENLQITTIRKEDEQWKVALMVLDDETDVLAFVEMEPLEAQLFASVIAAEGDKANRRNASESM